MSTQFGPLDDDHERDSGLTAWLSDTMIVGTARLFTHFLDNSSIRYDPERNRLSLHGESEHAGEGFAVGVITMIVTVSAALLSVVPILIVGELSPLIVDSTATALVAVLTLAAIALITVGVIGTTIDRVSSIEVYDHRTTATDDERLGELRAAYARGDLDRDAFEAEVESVVEREGER